MIFFLRTNNYWRDNPIYDMMPTPKGHFNGRSPIRLVPRHVTLRTTCEPINKGAHHVSQAQSTSLLYLDLDHRNHRQFINCSVSANVASTTPSSESTASIASSPDTRDSIIPKPLAAKDGIRNSYGKLPLAFEPNNGQVDEQVKFLARGPGYNLFLTSTETLLALNNVSSRKGKPTNGRSSKQEVLKMRLLGGNPAVDVQGSDPLPGKSNYYHGNNREKWQTGISTYAKVRYHEVYPKIDMVYYGTQSQLEYDFEVAPGADPNVIGIEFSGTRRLKIDGHGELVLRTPSGKTLRQPKPLIYQEVDGKRIEIAGGYVLASMNKVSFRVGEYDRSLPLIIDPVVVYATYLGGSCPPICLFDGDAANGIATDGHGNSYVIGSTKSLNFPTTNALQPSRNSGRDVFIAKYNADGSAIIYSTYLGGSAEEFGAGIAADAAGNAYITGSTASIDFPITAGDHLTGTFITKLNSDGSALTYSVMVPGMAAIAIAVDHAGNTYLTGRGGDGFPLVNPIQPNPGGLGDAFVAKLNATGSGLIYSTFLGGSDEDMGNAIAVDDAGNAYVAGETASGDFPTVNPVQPVFGGGPVNGGAGPVDAFVTKINTTGSAFIYSTYLGGSNSDRALGIATNGSGDAFVTGATFSPNFPITNALQATLHSLVNAFVTRINANGSALVYSTYLGGSGEELGRGVASDGQGNAYITGFTSSTDFPIANASNLCLARPTG
jgi:hypothetical protein